MRTISPQFIQCLKSGELSFFLDQTRHDPDICMEIRKDYVSMYYMGGVFRGAEQERCGRLYRGLSGHASSEMDSWFACHPKAVRLFQHNLIKNNREQPAILDIDYAGWTSTKKLFRLDMLGVVRTDVKYKLIIFL